MRVSDLEDLSTNRGSLTQIIEVDGLSQAISRFEYGIASMCTWVSRIHTGDCLKLMRLMPTESIGLIFTMSGSTFYTDDHRGYKGINRDFKHENVFN